MQTTEGANEWPPVLPKGKCKDCGTPWDSESALLGKNQGKNVWKCRVCNLRKQREKRYGTNRISDGFYKDNG